MKIISTRTDGILTIALAGELDHHAARSGIARIGQLIDIELPHRTVLDLSQLSFMDSSGIAVIVNLYRRMQELDGSLDIVEAPNQAYKVIHAAGLDRMIPTQRAGALSTHKTASR